MVRVVFFLVVVCFFAFVLPVVFEATAFFCVVFRVWAGMPMDISTTRSMVSILRIGFIVLVLMDGQGVWWGCHLPAKLISFAMSVCAGTSLYVDFTVVRVAKSRLVSGLPISIFTVTRFPLRPAGS